MDDLFKMKKTTDVRIVIGSTDMTPIGYDKGLSRGYGAQKMIESVQKTTSEKHK